MEEFTAIENEGSLNENGEKNTLYDKAAYNEQERMQLIRQSYIDIINIVSDAIYVLDQTFTFIEINKGAEIMYQYSREELIGLNPTTVAAPGLNDMELIQSRLQSVLETGEPERFDFWARRKNGEIFPKDVIVNRGKFFDQNVLIATARDMSDKIKSENVLKDYENRYETLLKKSGIGVGNYSIDGKILYFNEKAIQHLGGKLEDYIGKSVLDVFGKDTGSEYMRRFQLVATSEKSLEFEDFVSFANRDYWFLSNHTKIIDNQGELVGIEVIAHDITDRKLAEKEIEQSQLEFKDLFENAPIGYHEIDLEGRIVRINQTELDMLGYTYEELKGQYVWKLVADSDYSIKRTREKLRGFQLRLEPYEREFLRKDGTKLSVLIMDKLITIDNEVGGIRSSIQNITYRKEAELEVQKISKHYQAIIEKSPDGFVLLNAEGLFEYASPSALRMFGYELSELTSTHPNELTHPDDLAMVLDHLARLFENPTYVPVIEYRFMHKNGDWLWIESTFRNLLADPNVESILINFRNINDRKYAEEKILNTKQLLRDLLQENSELIESNDEEIDFEKFCEQIKEISGAKYVSFNLYEPNGLDFRTMALAGMKNIYSRAAQFMGFEIKNKIWKFDPIRDEKISKKTITRFEDMVELNGKVIPKPISKLIQSTMGIGEVNIVNISNKNKRIGDYTLYFDVKSTLQNSEIVELFANQVALYIERKLAESKLLRSEKLFKTIFETNPDIMTLTRLSDGIYVSVNNGFTDILGYQSDEVIGHSALEKDIWYDPTERKRLIDLIKKDNAALNQEYRFLTKGKKIIYALMSAKLIEIDGTDHLLAISRPINDLKEIQEELKSNEEKFRSIFEQSSLAIFLTNPATREILSANQAACQLFGATEEDLCQIGRGIIDFSDTRLEKMLIEREKNGKVIGELNFIRKDGTCFEGELLSVIFKDSLGNDRNSMIIQDLTQRKESEKSIKENLERLNRAELASKSGNWEFHLNTNKMIVSDGANRVYGLNKEFYSYDDVKDVPLSEYRPMMDETLKKLIEKDEPYSIEFKIKTADSGEIKDIHSTATFDKESKIVFGVIHDITDRKKAEENLRLSEVKFRNAFENSVIGKSITTFAGKVSVNNAFCEIVGYSHDELSQMTWMQFTHKDDLERNIKIIDSIIKGELNYENWEKRYIHKDGHIVWVDITTMILRDKNENPIHLVTEIFDITARKEAEIKLRESENKYRILFADNPQPMLVYDLETLAVLEVNQTAVDFYGYSKDEFLSMTIKELHPTEEFPIFMGMIEKTKEGIDSDGISTHIKKTGEKIYVNISSTTAPIYGRNARHVLIVDITERKIAEEKLAESESFFRQSQQAARIGSYNLNFATGMWSSSEVMNEIFGIDNQYVRSVEGWLELVAEQDREMMNDYFTNHVVALRQRFNKEYRVCRKSDGKVFWVLGLGELAIENDVIISMVGTIQDITERKIIEDVLKAKMDDLIRFQKVTVGRELMMIELKKEINELLAKLGQEPKYKIVV